MSQMKLDDVIRNLRNADYKSVIQANSADIPVSDTDVMELLRGISFFLDKQPAEGVPLLNKTVSTMTVERALSANVLSELALAHFLLGYKDDSVSLLQKQLEEYPDDALSYGRLGTVLLSKDMLAEATENYREAVRREPGRAEWHNNLGGVLLRQQLLDEALENYDIALRLKPDLEQAKASRDSVLISLDRTDDVVQRLEEELQDAPESLLARLKLARGLASAQRFMEAINLLIEPCMPVEELLDEDAANASDASTESEGDRVSTDGAKGEDDDTLTSVSGQIALRTTAAKLLADRSVYPHAAAILDEILRLKPNNALPYIIQKANALIEMGKYEDTEKLLDEAESEYPDANPIKLTRAHLYCEVGRYDDAEMLQRELMETYPGDAHLKIQLGQTLLWTGKLDEASLLFEEASKTNPMALAQMVNAKRIPEDPNAISRMSKIADNVLVPDGARITMSFALSEVYEKIKDYDKSFHYLKLANDLTDKTLEYDCDDFQKQVTSNKHVYTFEYFRSIESIRGSDRTPIFVVGMPRSGTTLTEQILCSHKDVFGAGELDLLPRLTRLIPRVLKTRIPYPHCLDRFSAHLREEAARFYLHGIDKLDQEHPYVVDKMPHNFMNVGLIKTILPKAKVIHIQRDPRDTALSNYQQNFKARNGGLGYAFNLEKLANEFNSYYEMMEHWRSVLPGYMLEIKYEDLVADQEAITRQMLEFCGLDWDENVTNFHETKRAVRTASVAQVRQKIYSSSKQKWRRYEKHLTPLLERLNPELTAPWDKEVFERLETS